MMNRVFALLGVFAVSTCAVTQAQDYDDIYGTSSSKPKKVVVKTQKSNSTGITTVEAVTGSSSTFDRTSSTISNNENWDVDAYNRRGAAYETATEDTVTEETSTFSNTERIERFYNPDIVVKSEDDELLELYFNNNTQANVNIIVGTPTYYPVFTTGFYTSWYTWDFYDPFFRPWSWGIHSPWYYGGWSWGWHRPWYRPWHDWSWHRPWHDWGWHHHHWSPYYGRDHWRHTAGWDRPGHHSYRSGLGTVARRPQTRFGTSTLSNNSRMGSNSGVRRAGAFNGNTTGNSRTGVGMNNGRTRPSTGTGTGTGMNNGRRPGSVGNVGNIGNGSSSTRATRDIVTRNAATAQRGESTGRTMGEGSRRSSYDSSNASRRSYDSGSSNRSYGSSSRSYDSGSRSSGFGGGRSSGGFSGGGHSGGFSGGHSGGGGGRRH